MSFDLFLQRFKRGRPAPADRGRVREALDAVARSGPDRHGFYTVHLPDGAEVELSAQGLDGTGEFSGCAFHVRELSDPLAQLIYDVARAGDMVIFAGADECEPILTADAQHDELPEDLFEEYPEPAVCRSAGQLRSALESAWQSAPRDEEAQTGEET